MTPIRLTLASSLLAIAAVPCLAQQAAQPSLPDAPSAPLLSDTSALAALSPSPSPSLDSPAPLIFASSTSWSLFSSSQQTTPAQQDPKQTARQSDQGNKPHKPEPLDANGNPIPLNRQQPQRILGFMPNFRSVAAGSAPPPPGWKYNFRIATHQAFDYSSFIFLGLTSITAEALNSHPALGKGVGGFYAYTWRGLLDKTDGTYLSGFVLNSALREDTRYYPLGDGHRVLTRALYVISRQGVARDYSGHNVFNAAGLGGKVLTQYISRSYYPASATNLSVLATKFAYSAMRDIGFSSIREFYPDIAAHYVRKHRAKLAAIAAATANQATTATTPDTRTPLPAPKP